MWNVPDQCLGDQLGQLVEVWGDTGGVEVYGVKVVWANRLISGH